nr:reticulon-like protein B2 [Ipomoea batatas]
MVSELAGEEAMPPQLPAPASHAKLRIRLRRGVTKSKPDSLVRLLQPIRSGSLLRRGVTKLKQDSLLARFNLFFLFFNLSAVLSKSSSWSRSVRNSSKVLVVAFNSGRKSMENMSAELFIIDRSSRSRSAEKSSVELAVAISTMVSRSQNFDVIVSTQQSNVCLIFNCKEASDWPKKGCRRLTGVFADLCVHCASTYKEGGIVADQKSVLEIGGEELGGSKLSGIIIPGIAPLDVNLLDLDPGKVFVNCAEAVQPDIFHGHDSSLDSDDEKHKESPVEAVKTKIYLLFGREKVVHNGGGKPADISLWRYKKVPVRVLDFTTAILVVFELLEYHSLTLVCHIDVLSSGWNSDESSKLMLPSDQETDMKDGLVKMDYAFFAETIVVGDGAGRFLYQIDNGVNATINKDCAPAALAITRRLREDGSLIGVLNTEQQKTDEGLLRNGQEFDISVEHYFNNLQEISQNDQPIGSETISFNSSVADQEAVVDTVAMVTHEKAKENETHEAKCCSIIGPEDLKVKVKTLLFWCMLLGHYIRGLEYPLEYGTSVTAKWNTERWL